MKNLGISLLIFGSVWAIGMIVGLTFLPSLVIGFFVAIGYLHFVTKNANTPKK